jgi:hypothetical protein
MRETKFAPLSVSQNLIRIQLNEARTVPRGLPSTQSELVRWSAKCSTGIWYQTRRDEQAPDDSTVRRKIALIWRELNRA